MDISKLEVGMVVKNYRELCNLLGEDVKSGKSKVAQLKELSRYIEYSKDKNKFIIDEVYHVPLPPNNKNYNKKHLSETRPEHYLRIVDVNNYDEDNIYVTSECVVKWKCSICDTIFEKSIFNMCNAKIVRCNDCNSSSGEKLVGKTLRDLELVYEKEIKFDGLVSDKGNSLRFDFGIYMDSELLCLIEYDGQYHDEIEIIMYHDKIKNKYCEDNNIPLLRIHHSVDKNDVNMMIIKFIYNIKKSNNLKNELLLEINKQLEYKSKLENRIKVITNNIKELENLL